MAQRTAAEQSPDIPEKAEKVSENDLAATDFAEIVRRHQSAVFSIALHFLADRSAAEELAQDVFLQLHANLPTIKSDDHMKFWLRKVTAHRCIDHKRRRSASMTRPNRPRPAHRPTSSWPEGCASMSRLCRRSRVWS